MRDFFYLSLYKIFSFFVSIMPTSLLDNVLQGLSSILYASSKKYQHVINTNLNIAFEDISPKERIRIGKRTYLNFLHNISGFIRRKDQTPEEILKNITFINDQALKKALKEGKNVIFMTAHYGNWELLPIALTSHYGIKMSIVGKSLQSQPMQDILRKNREEHNITLIDKKGAIREMIKAFAHKRAIGLLVDHHTTINEGAVIDFFGKKATQTMSAAMLARKFDAIIFPVFISSEDFHHHSVRFYPPIMPIKTDDSKANIQKMTQQQATVIEEAIKVKPDEWFWLHRRWKHCCRDAY